jgi:hypothetical protein
VRVVRVVRETTVSAGVYAPAGDPAFGHTGNGGHLFGPWYRAADD